MSHPTAATASVNTTSSTTTASGPFDKLPPELSSRIFEFVSASSQKHIANCRLVSLEFRTICSPYLITTVVVANRLETLRKFVEVMEDPYFSKHVTHLIWDASWYEEDVAQRYETYQYRARTSTHLSESRDAEYITAREADAELLDQLSHTQGILKEMRRRKPGIILPDFAYENPLNAPPTLSNFMHFSESTRPPPLPQVVVPRQPIVSATTYSNISRSPLFQNALHEDGNHMLGFHPGSQDYYRRWDSQWRLDRADVAIKQFKRAFTRLRNIKHISYTDWRALAREGESYDELCRRLFGSTVTPVWNLLHRDHRSHLIQFLSVVGEAPWSLRSLTIGRHPFQFDSFDEKRYSSRYSAYKPQEDSERRLSELPIVPFLSSDTMSTWTALLPNLHSLYLPEFTEELGDYNSESAAMHAGHQFDEARSVLALATPRLAELGLSASKSDAHLDRYGEPDIFHSLLLPLQFQRLRSLSLRGLCFKLEDLGNFLLAHKSTLRVLHIIDSHCKAPYEDFMFLVENWGPQLSLTGVEVVGLRFEEVSPPESEQELRAEHARLQRRRERFGEIYFGQELGRHERSLRQRRRDEAERVDNYHHSCAGWPGERPEIERELVDGRGNGVSRQAVWVGSDEERKHWYRLPNRGSV